MYFITYGNNHIHDPRTDELIVTDISLNLEENSIGYCEFNMYPSNPMYGRLTERDTVNVVQVFDGEPSDDNCIFVGFVEELGKNFQLDGKVKCQGMLGLLYDETLKPYGTFDNGFGLRAPSTINGYLEWLILTYNEQVDSSKKFKMGINQANIINTVNYIEIDQREYSTYFKEIQEQILDSFGGYISCRRVNGENVIDFIANWSETNSQILDFGINLMDYTVTDDSTELYTYVVPLGAKLCDTEYEYDMGYYLTTDDKYDPNKVYFTHDFDYKEAAMNRGFKEGKEYYEKKPGSDDKYIVTKDTSMDYSKVYFLKVDKYSEIQENEITSSFISKWSNNKSKYYEYLPEKDQSQLALTIEGLQPEDFNSDMYFITGDKVVNREALNKYGWLGYSYSNTDIVDKEDLVPEGMLDLVGKIIPAKTFEIQAIDMHFVEESYKPIRLGEYVRIRSIPHGVDSYYCCRKIDLDLSKPDGSLYTFGAEQETLLSGTDDMVKKLNSTFDSRFDQVRALTESTNAELHKVDSKTNTTTTVLDYPSLYLTPITYEGFAYKIQNGLAHLAVALLSALPEPIMVYQFYTPLVATKNDDTKSYPNIIFDLSDCVLNNPCGFCDVTLSHGKQSYISIMETYEYGADYENIPIEETSITRGMRFTLNRNDIPVSELEPYYDITISGTAHATWIDAETREVSRYDTKVNYTYRLHVVSLDDQADWPEFIEMGTLGEPENAENATKEEVEKIVSVQEAIEQVGERVTELEKAPSTQQVFYTTTEESTPFDVYTMLQKPGMVIIESKITIDGVVVIPVKFTYCLYSEEMMAIVTSGIVYFYGNYLVFELIGDLASNTWSQLGPEVISINGHTHEEYITNTDFASNEKAGVVRTSPSSGTKMGSSGVILGTTRTKEQYDSNDNSLLISKGTLKNVLEPLIKRIEELEARPTIIVGTTDPDNSQGRTHDIYVQYNEEEQ